MKENLCNMSYDELVSFVQGLGEPRFRADQLWQWIFEKNIQDFTAMTNLSQGFRDKLTQVAEVPYPVVKKVQKSADGTQKLLLELHDGALVETVLIKGKDNLTQCLSTQVGCALGCTFCATGQMGLIRNMTLAEIVGQVLVAKKHREKEGLLPLKKLVFMGMGEPLMNMAELMRSLYVLTHKKGLCFSPRRITVSTAGVVSGLQELGASGLCMLAVSLHAPVQELREKIMPVAARIAPLNKLMAALEDFPLKARERITYEYILLAGVNDRPEHAKALARLLGGRKAKVNLIAYNKEEAAAYKTPAPEDIVCFEKILWSKGLTAILRQSKGQDIQAACGQLQAAYKKDKKIKKGLQYDNTGF